MCKMIFSVDDFEQNKLIGWLFKKMFELQHQLQQISLEISFLGVNSAILKSFTSRKVCFSQKKKSVAAMA